MPLYHFNVYDGTSSPDQDGTELADIDQARREAVRLAGQLLCDVPETFWTGDDWRLEVTDDIGLVLLSLHFFASETPTTLRP